MENRWVTMPETLAEKNLKATIFVDSKTWASHPEVWNGNHPLTW
jgi:hypothetical protein